MRKHPDGFYTIESHRKSHNVSYQTARTDLFKLADHGLVTTTKRGRAFVFAPAEDFERQLHGLAHRTGLGGARAPVAV